MGKHLTYENRCHIYAYIKSGKSQREIAKLIGCSHTTINKEIKRNSGQRGYREKQAQKLALERTLKARCVPRKLTPEIVDCIKKHLTDHQWSPAQISGRLNKDGIFTISPESIYRLIWDDKKCGGDLYKNLRHRAKKYNRRASQKGGRGVIPNRMDIEERPPIVEKKSRFGDLELDTIVGKNHQGAIVSIVDRASKYVWLRLVPRATAENVAQAICNAVSITSQENQAVIHTMTSDNGKEFAAHESIAQQTGALFFFAKPYHSWERGLNEHTNGLVRQYFPKGADFTILTPEAVAEVERKLNNRPRKILDFETPFEALARLTQPHILAGNFTS